MLSFGRHFFITVYGDFKAFFQPPCCCFFKQVFWKKYAFLCCFHNNNTNTETVKIMLSCIILIKFCQLVLFFDYVFYTPFIINDFLEMSQTFSGSVIEVWSFIIFIFLQIKVTAKSQSSWHIHSQWLCIIYRVYKDDIEFSKYGTNIQEHRKTRN